MESGLKGLKNGNGQPKKGLFVFQGRDGQWPPMFTLLYAAQAWALVSQSNVLRELYWSWREGHVSANSKRGYEMKTIKTELYIG